MIKNQANKPIKSVNTATTAIKTTAANIISDDDDNRNTYDVDAGDKPLSKLDIIKKFDNKYKVDKIEESVKNEKAALEECLDNDCKNMAAGDDSNSEEDASRSDHSAGNGAGTPGSVPPKPMPRTSRNNSTCSDQGFIMLGDEVTPRPVAKPRTSASSYKVPHISLFPHTKTFYCFSSQFFVLFVMISIFSVFFFLFPSLVLDFVSFGFDFI